MKSLKLKILLPVLILVGLGFLSSGVFTYLGARDAVIEQVHLLADTKLEKMATRLDDQLLAWVHQVQMIANMQRTQDMDWGKVNEYIQANREQLSGFEMIYLADKTGRFRASSGTDGSIAERAYFPLAMSGQVVVSDPVNSKATGQNVVAIVAPVRSASGQVIGVLGATVELSSLTTFVNAETIGEHGYGYMLDQTGLVIAHPNANWVMQQKLTEHSNQDLASISRSMLNGESGTDEYVLDGARNLVFYRPLENASWSVAMTADYNEVAATVAGLRARALLVGFGTLLITLLAANWLIGRSVRPIVQMVAITKQVAGGNLRVTVPVESEDEVGTLAQSFNEMVEQVRALLGEMREMGLTVASAAEQMTASANEASRASEQVAVTISDLAKGATQQAESAEQGNEMVRRMVAGLSAISSDADVSNQMTGEAVLRVAEGLRSIDEQKRQMAGTKRATANVAQAVTDLSAKSQQIERIVELINSVATQTNLLALNAAIEAARAGEQGKGFAVVADQVRQLAEQSRQATGQIADLIKQIIVGVASAVSEMQATEAAVGQQEVAVSGTDATFQQIRATVLRLQEQIEAMNQAAVALSGNAEEAEGAIENIAAITEESAASAEEVAASTEEQSAAAQQIAASSESLAKLAVRLQEAINRFTV